MSYKIVTLFPNPLPNQSQHNAERNTTHRSLYLYLRSLKQTWFYWTIQKQPCCRLHFTTSWEPFIASQKKTVVNKWVISSVPKCSYAEEQIYFSWEVLTVQLSNLNKLRKLASWLLIWKVGSVKSFSQHNPVVSSCCTNKRNQQVWTWAMNVVVRRTQANGVSWS